MLVWIIELLYTVHITDLRRVVDSLYVASDAFGVVRIFRIVTVQISHPLLVVACLLPKADELRKLLVVHERNIVYMSVYLSCQHDVGWSALSADSFRIRQMANLTVVIDFIALIL